MRSRSPHLLPGQSAARQAELLSSSPLESWHAEIARGGIFSADKLAALFLALGLFFSQLAFVATPAAEASGSSPTLDPIGNQSAILGDPLAFTATASRRGNGAASRQRHLDVGWGVYLPARPRLERNRHVPV